MRTTTVVGTFLSLYVRIRERLSNPKGQTMTEYAMILGSIAIIVVAGFRLMGRQILDGPLDEIREEFNHWV